MFWTKTRVDVLNHRSTHWFSDREHGLRLQCQCENQLGLLERSLASMARIASGDGRTVTVTAGDIEESISRLASAGHVVWFREFEVLWWVEMADEQKPPGTEDQVKFWNQIRDQVVVKLVNQIRRLICDRYPHLISKNPSNDGVVEKRSGPDLHQIPIWGNQDRELDEELDRDQERENKPSRDSATGPRSRSGSKSRSSVDATLVDRVIALINEHRARLIENAVGFRTDSKSQRRWVEKATKREGASFEDWKLRIGHLAEAASRDEFWIQHLTLQYLHWAKNWEKWEHASSIPAPRRGSNGGGGSGSGGGSPSYAPGDFSKPENCTNRGIPLPDKPIDPNAEETL